MTEEERHLLNEIHRILKGNGLSQEKGLIGRIIGIETRQESIDKRLKRIYNVVFGVAIGLLIGGLMFGILSWDSFVKLLKSIK